MREASPSNVSQETNVKHVYRFGGGTADGKATMKNLLGGKGANLAEMSRIGIPVPPGFTLTTEVSVLYNEMGRDKAIALIQEQVENSINWCGEIMGMHFGKRGNPLMFSVRSGARVSMPGMMDTVLNLGLNDEIVEGAADKWDNKRFAWDSYRRLIQMYGNVVMGLAPEDKTESDPFEVEMDDLKREKGVSVDTDLSWEDLKVLTERFKALIRKKTGSDFPQDPWEQLWGAILAVFASWNNERARVYRDIHNIPHDWGTAVNIQVMVYGNLNKNSATGVAFTRDAATGEDLFNGEYLLMAQGEDVVAGTRTPRQITLEGSKRWAALAHVSEEERRDNYASLEEAMPDVYAELVQYETQLENHYKEMQDLEFTVQDGKLWILQTRTGKRTAHAMVKIAMDMIREEMIDEKTALLRMEAERLNDLLHPVFEDEAVEKASIIGRGLPASPGAATGQIVFFADDVEEWHKAGKEVVLVRHETSPEDLRGMHLAQGILTSRGGMTSHAAVVARGMGKCCISGAGAIDIDYKSRTFKADGETFREGDWISLNGTTGEIYKDKVPTRQPDVHGDFAELLKLAERHARMTVRSNADTPEEARIAREFDAMGIGLCRTEHMFFEGNRITAVREMILAHNEKERRVAIAKLLPMQRSDFESLFETMRDLPVTIRLLDPPLHEFLPRESDSQKDLAQEMDISLERLQDKINELSEINPMMGLRGCRLGITHPEITEMQTRAIIEAALNVKKRGIQVFPEIMVPLIGGSREFKNQAKVIRTVANEIFSERGDSVDFKVGAMIEIPRAAITAERIAKYAEFFSFGTNDLTQMTLGFSRDDIGNFLPVYLEEGIIDYDPFQRIDETGVGVLVQNAVEKGRKTRPDIKLGICGEHGGNPESIYFCNRVGLEYVSCSPYRVPIAWVAAAQAAIAQEPTR